MGRRDLPLLGRLYFWLAERLYHELAWAYEIAAWLASAGQWSTWRRQALDHVAGPRVLELGFGTGRLLQIMADRGWSAYGVDPSEEMQRLARRRLRRARRPAPTVQARAQALPFRNAAFDGVVATFPTGYIVAPETLREAARVLRPGGRLVVAGVRSETDSRLWACLTGLVHGRAGGDLDARYAAMASAAGLEMTVVPGRGRWVRWPIWVLTRGTGAG